MGNAIPLSSARHVRLSAYLSDGCGKRDLCECVLERRRQC